MKNTYKVFWSDEAVKGLAEIIEYIEHRFTEKDVRKFVRLFDDTIELIRSNPEIFPLSKKINFHQKIDCRKTDLHILFHRRRKNYHHHRL